ncbi:F-box protein [Raphanus sativus]|nr:F-box protein [Raphanus sativus]
MTLGTRGMRWRKIKFSLRVEIVSEGVCINGVLYYLGDMWDYKEVSEARSNYVIVCFDVRSEKFKFLYPESFCELINYKGKLGVVYYDDLTDDAIELRVWVLEDVKKQEWSKYSYTLRGDKLFPHYSSVVGVISTGEIVLSMTDYTSKQPFYIYYFNPERNTIRRVEIQGFGEYHLTKPSEKPSRVYVFLDDCSRFYTFVDHVENLNVNDPRLLKCRSLWRQLRPPPNPTPLGNETAATTTTRPTEKLSSVVETLLYSEKLFKLANKVMPFGPTNIEATVASEVRAVKVSFLLRNG